MKPSVADIRRKHVSGSEILVQYGIEGEGESIPLLECKKFGESSPSYSPQQ